MKKITLLLLLLAISLYARKTYTVTIEPQKFFLEKIGQSKINVRTIFEGINFRKEIEHVYFRRFSFSDVYFTVGIPQEEKYLQHILGFNSRIKVVDMSDNLDKLQNEGEDNPYFWTDPIKVVQATEIMLDTLIEEDPENEKFYRLNYETLLMDLDRIFLRLRNTLFTETKSVYVFDEKWDYFFSRFGVRSYRADNEILKGSKYTEIFRKSREKDIRYLLVDKDIDREVYRSWSQVNNMTVVEADIYAYNWFADLFILSEKIAGKE